MCVYVCLHVCVCVHMCVHVYNVCVVFCVIKQYVLCATGHTKFCEFFTCMFALIMIGQN